MFRKRAPKRIPIDDGIKDLLIRAKDKVGVAELGRKLGYFRGKQPDKGIRDMLIGKTKTIHEKQVKILKELLE